LDLVRERVHDATVALGKIMIEQEDGYLHFTGEFKRKLKESLSELMEIRDRLSGDIMVMSRILMVLIMLILISCDEAQTAFQKDRKEKERIVESCVSQGGIPIMSIWDKKMLKDCIFKPK